MISSLLRRTFYSQIHVSRQRNFLGAINSNLILKSFASIPMISLSNLRPSPGSNKRRKRVGRGIGGGGRTCGRGNSGQKSRSGGSLRVGFEGGQFPAYLKVPKRGHHNPHKKELTLVSLEKLQFLIDTGRIDPGKPIDIGSFSKAGINGIKDGVKLMGRGSNYFRSKVIIEATKFTSNAIERIESLGGLAVSVYHDEAGIRQAIRPRSTKIHPSLPQPKFRPPMNYKERLWYSRYENRGYLNPAVRSKLIEMDKTFEDRYVMVKSLEPIKAERSDLRNIAGELREMGILPP